MMADIDLFGVSFEHVKGFKLPDGEGGEAEFVSPPAGTIEITENDTYDVSDYASAAVSVALQMNLQEKTVTPGTSRQEVRADTEQGYDALEDVIVEAVPTAVQAVPSLTLDPSTGVITATALQLAGYVSGGTTSDTLALSTQAAQTIHPSTSDQTIASGRYLTGNQTIKAVTVSGLSADKILSGTTVKIGDSTDDDCVTSVSGSVSFQTIYSGSSAPSSAQGVDGDIYIQTA